MNNKKLKKYVDNFVKYQLYHDKFLTKLIKENLGVSLNKEIYELIISLKQIGLVNRRYLQSLCQSLIYGILNNEVIFISMNSNALQKDSKFLRDKPQYKKIYYINQQLENIFNKYNIKYKYINILPDYMDEFPLYQYDKLWEKNKEYLEEVSSVKTYRLSDIYVKKEYNEIKNIFLSHIDKDKLNRTIEYYKTNKFIKLSFTADENFQERQIINYIIVGMILEKCIPFCILLDVQKNNYPFEQKFYNYMRNYKIPIIFCGQKF